MLPSMRAMIVKQGLSCSDCGKAELNAVSGCTTRLHCCRADDPLLACCGAQAFSNLGDMMTAVGVLMWGYLYQFFLTTTARPWVTVGKGGHMLVCAALLVVSWALLKCIPAAQLFIDDAPAKTSKE